ncbi:transposase [Archangium violaceum]|uniref:transposase n=1 Tax=Archangium violaceum TaxID=83451 RepID=UPI0023B87E0F|nr:transposase [Archangium violaceum]
MTRAGAQRSPRRGGSGPASWRSAAATACACRYFHANDRQGLERLCRYGARGALALERLSRAEDGRIAWRMNRTLPDGTTHLLFTGLELFTACGVPGASASGKPHEVPRRLRSRHEAAAIPGPPSSSGGGEHGA